MPQQTTTVTARAHPPKMIVKVTTTRDETVLPAKLGKHLVVKHLQNAKILAEHDIVKYKENKKLGHVTIELTGTHKVTADTIKQIRTSGPQETNGPLKWMVSNLPRARIGVIKGIPLAENPAEVGDYLKNNNQNVAEVRKIGSSTIYTIKFLTNCLPKEIKTAYGTRSVHTYVKTQKQGGNLRQTEKASGSRSPDLQTKDKNYKLTPKSTSLESSIMSKEKEHKQIKKLSYAQMVTGAKDIEEKEDSFIDKEEMSQLTRMIRQIVKEEIKEYFERTQKKDQQEKEKDETQTETDQHSKEDKEKSPPIENGITRVTKERTTTNNTLTPCKKMKADKKEITKAVKENLENLLTPKSMPSMKNVRSAPLCSAPKSTKTKKDQIKNLLTPQTRSTTKNALPSPPILRPRLNRAVKQQKDNAIPTHQAMITRLNARSTPPSLRPRKPKTSEDKKDTKGKEGRAT